MQVSEPALALEDLNLSIEYIALDDASDSTQSVQLTKKLLSEQNQPVQALPPKRGTFDTPH